MLRVWADRLLRVSAGLALLLLLAAEQKVCPWLLKPPAQRGAAQDKADRASTPIAADNSPSDSSKKDESSQTRPSLSSGLPDAVPARFPSVPKRATLEETVGWREGAVACGSLEGAKRRGIEGGVAADLGAPWQAGWGLRVMCAAIPPGAAGRAVRDPALGTVLLKTGPPAA